MWDTWLLYPSLRLDTSNNKFWRWFISLVKEFRAGLNPKTISGMLLLENTRSLEHLLVIKFSCLLQLFHVINALNFCNRMTLEIQFKFSKSIFLVIWWKIKSNNINYCFLKYQQKSDSRYFKKYMSCLFYKTTRYYKWL